MGKLYRSGLPFDVVKKMESGVKMTIKEWARAYGVPYSQMAGILTRLRQKGFHYHPYDGQIRVKGSMRTGILVDITENPEFFRRGMNRYQDHFAAPYLSGMFRVMEKGITEHPELSSDIRERMTSLNSKMIGAERKVLGRGPQSVKKTDSGSKKTIFGLFSGIRKKKK